MESAPACGGKPWPLLTWYDPRSSSWRTWQLSWLEGWTPYSEAWPRSGMTRNGIAYRLPTLAHRTSGTASGLWPTPNVPNGGQAVPADATWGKSGLTAYRKDGKKIQVGLESAVKMWPTPSAMPAPIQPGLHSFTGQYWKKPDGRKHQTDLRLAVLGRMWPPPSATDWKGSNRPGQRRGQLSEVVAGGLLNPQWVEWLMGYPTGWTALEPLETP